MKDNSTFDTLSWWLIGIAVLLALFSFLSPLIFTRSGIVDFSNTGQMGDTIGGIMNPFIGMISCFRIGSTNNNPYICHPTVT